MCRRHVGMSPNPVLLRFSATAMLGARCVPLLLAAVLLGLLPALLPGAVTSASTVTSAAGKAHLRRTHAGALNPLDGSEGSEVGDGSDEGSSEGSEASKGVDADPLPESDQNSWGDIWDDPIDYNKLASSDIHGRINVIRNQNTLVNTVLDKQEAYRENEELIKKKAAQEDSTKKQELLEEEKAKAKEVISEERDKKTLRDQSAEEDGKRTRQNAEEQRGKDEVKKDGEATIVGPAFQVTANYRRNFKIDARGAYSYTFWIKPLGKKEGWANVLHSANRRRPAVWFHPSSTRLHIRSESPQGWNTGCDPSAVLTIGTWLHVAFVHDDKGMRVYYDGKQVCTTKIGGPLDNQASFIWLGMGTNPANAQLADLRYYAESISEDVIQRAARFRKYVS